MQNRIVISLTAAFALTMAMPAAAQVSGSKTPQANGKIQKGGGKYYRSGGKKYRGGGKYYRGGGDYSGGGGHYSEGGGNVSQYGTPDVIKGLGTYAGDLYASRFPGNGNYFYYGFQDYYYPPQELPKPPLARNGAKIIDVQKLLNATQNPASVESGSGAKIIDVQQALNEMTCDEETKVCLIKP